MDVTIVIPTYKRADRIVRAVNSALEQTVKDKEVIVVDDNGKNSKAQLETEQALRDFIANQKITYLVNEVNRGGSFSRNAGLEIATGKYITFLDDDDEIDPKKLEIQMNKLEEMGEEYSCCYTGYHKLLANDAVYKNAEKVEGYVYPYALARSIYVGSGSNLLVKTEVARRIHGYDISFKRNQDLEFMARLLKDYKLAYVEDDLMTIHYEIREVKRSYQDMVNVDTFFVNNFKKEIDSLPEKQRKGVYDTIALERFRYSLSRREWKDAIHNLKVNHVSFITFIRYILYLADRVTGKKSYGFKAFKI